MFLFIKRYLTTLSGLLLLMGLYHLVLVPAIEPPLRPAAPLPTFSGALGGAQWWQDLFPEGAWQTDNPKIVQSDRGILLSDSWEQVGPKTLRLQPLTMILPLSSSPGAGGDTLTQQDVWIVSAEQGAVIHFEKPLDLTGGTIPSVERGHLSGQIRITRQTAAKSNERPWSLVTSDLSIDRSRVFTQQQVSIEWGQGIVQGRDLKLTLQGDLLGSTGQESSPWGPLRTLELYHVDRIHMGLEPGGLWANAKLPKLPGQPSLATLPAQMELKCGGRFTFDFTRSQASLVGGVHLIHQLGELAADEFQSQEVVVDIQPPVRQAGMTRAASLRNGMLQVKQIEARGIDSLENFVGERKVELKAPTIGAFASAKRLKVNVAENRIELDGQLGHAGATQSIAWLKYLDYEFTSPRIDYDGDGAGQPLDTQQLGFLVAQGPGEMRMPASSEMGSGLVRWQDSLEMRPTETAGLQWVGLFGNVLVESGLHGYMASDQLEIWLRKQQPATGTPVTGTSVPGTSVPGTSVPGNLDSGSLATAESPADYLPERLHASGRITLSTEQIEASVSDLNIAINYVAPAPPAGEAAAADGLALSDSAGRPMYQWLQPPSPLPTAQPGMLSAHVGATAAAPTAQPVAVTGRSLHSTLIVAGDQSWVDNMTIEGPLKVTGTAPRPGLPPWHVEGDQLQLATNPAGQVDMQITGRPARIALAEGSLAGPNIRFDQQSNLIWMDQPGEFTIPTSALAAPSSAQTPAGPPQPQMDWFKPPHCSWKGHMLFDGQIVRIEGEIQFDGAVRTEQNQFWWINGYCDQLQFELSNAIDMNRPGEQLAEPVRVTVSQNVNILASQLDQAGNKKSREQIQLPSLTFDIQSNEIIGLGPGSLRSWHLLKGSFGKMGASGNATPAAESLQGAHLVFRDSLRGFLQRSELYMEGKVEVAAGPLASWDDTIDLAQMQQLSLDQMLLHCDLLKVYDTSGLSSTASLTAGSQNAGGPSGAGGLARSWEIQAKGNVTFEGKAESGDYQGAGSEVTYIQAIEQLRLFGEPRRPASIKRTPFDRVAEGSFEASVEYAAINPRTLAIESYRVGENGIRFELPGAASSAANANTGNAPVTPGLPVNNNVPNPRGGVSGFFQRN